VAKPDYICDEDLKESFAKYSWMYKNGYVVRNKRVDGQWKELRMHHVVLGIKPGQLGTAYHVHHINGNPLDNRKENLEIVAFDTHQRRNRGYQNSTSQYKGVSWCKRTKKWIVQTSIGGSKKFLGYYTDELSAAQAYNKYMQSKYPDATVNEGLGDNRDETFPTQY